MKTKMNIDVMKTYLTEADDFVPSNDEDLKPEIKNILNTKLKLESSDDVKTLREGISLGSICESTGNDFLIFLIC